MNSDEPPAVLRERVTSKGGTIAAALASFDASGVKEAIVRGALAADARAKEMGDEFGKAVSGYCPLKRDKPAGAESLFNKAGASRHEANRPPTPRCVQTVLPHIAVRGNADEQRAAEPVVVQSSSSRGSALLLDTRS